MKLDSSVSAIVTGGASGLGGATVKALRAAGVKVVPYTPPRSWDMFEDYFGLLSADGFKTGLAVIEIIGAPQTESFWRAYLNNLPKREKWIIDVKYIRIVQNEKLRQKNPDWTK